MAWVSPLAGEVWQTTLARDREIELLYAGNQLPACDREVLRERAEAVSRTLEDLLKRPAQARHRTLPEKTLLRSHDREKANGAW